MTLSKLLLTVRLVLCCIKSVVGKRRNAHYGTASLSYHRPPNAGIRWIDCFADDRLGGYRLTQSRLMQEGKGKIADMHYFVILRGAHTSSSANSAGCFVVQHRIVTILHAGYEPDLVIDPAIGSPDNLVRTLFIVKRAGSRNTKNVPAINRGSNLTSSIIQVNSGPTSTIHNLVQSWSAPACLLLDLQGSGIRAQDQNDR